MDDLLDRFYEQISMHPELNDLFVNRASKNAARNAQKKHWLDFLFCDDIGKEHFDNAERIGRTHERIGLTLGNYLDGYCIMVNQFVGVIGAHFRDDRGELTETLQALNKAMFLDMNSVIDSYLDAKDQAMLKVLNLAELFTSSLKKINVVLGRQAAELHEKIAGTQARTELLDQRCQALEQKISGLKKHGFAAPDSASQEIYELLQDSASLLKANMAIHAEIGRAERDALQLAEGVCGLNSHYEKLQKEHKCSFPVASRQSVLDRVKSFFIDR